jgi:hypothetical protein
MTVGATAANAATVAVDPAASVYSREALGLVGGAVAVPNVVVTLGNNYTYQDDLLITIGGGATMLTGTPSASCVGGIGTTTLGFVERSGNTLDFRITNQEGATTGTVCTFSGIVVDALSLSNAGQMSVSYTGRRFITNQIIDSGSLPAGGVSVASQFTVTVNEAFDAVIDVAADRELFEGDEDTDVLSFTVDYYSAAGTYFPGPTSVPPVAELRVDPTAATFTITGDFSFAADGTGNCDAYLGGANVVLVGLAFNAAASDCTKMVLTHNAGAFDPAVPYSVSITVPGNKTLSPTDFAGEAKVDYVLSTDNTKSGTRTLTWDPGAWTINGAIVRIAYMPYGDTISQIIWIANKGTIDGDITVDYFTDDGHSGSFDLTTKAVHNSVTALAGEIKSKLEAAGFTAGKAHLTLVVTVSDRDVEVYSAYNVGGSDRGNVVNNSNGRSFYFGTGFQFGAD